MADSTDETSTEEVVTEEVSTPATADEGDGKFNPYRDERPMTQEQRDEWHKKNPGGRLAELSWPTSS